jgi:hypothetical protein
LGAEIGLLLAPASLCGFTDTLSEAAQAIAMWAREGRGILTHPIVTVRKLLRIGCIINEYNRLSKIVGCTIATLDCNFNVSGP